MRFARYGLFLVAVIGLVGSFGYIVYVPPADGPVELTGLTALLIADSFGVEELDADPVPVDGKLVSFDAYDGEIVIVDFWATWCGPCITEIPHYNAIDRDYRDKGVHLIGITIESGTTEEVVAFAQDERTHITYPLVMGNDDLLNTYGPVFGYPTTLLIDQEGEIVKRWIGASVGKSDQLRELLDKLLAGEPVE